MSEIHILAILTPAPGKADRLKEVIANTVKGVLHNEPDTLMFRFFEEANAEGASVIYAEETYKDQAAMDAHLNSTWFQAAGMAFVEENLLGFPLEVKTIRPFAGFKSR